MRAEFVVCIVKQKDQPLDILVWRWWSPALPRACSYVEGVVWSSQGVALC